MVLETPNLVQSLFMSISTTVPNFIIFSCSVDRAAIDSHSGGRIIIIKGKTYNYNRGYSPFGAWPLNIAASSNSGPSPSRGSSAIRSRKSKNSRN